MAWGIAARTACFVLVATVAACGDDSPDEVELSAEESADAEQLAADIGGLVGGVDLPEDEARCIARQYVALFHLPPADRAAELVDAHVACTDLWEAIFVRTRTEGADEISDDSTACVTDILADEDSQEMWEIELSGEFHNLTHLDPLLAAMDECLTQEELDRLDWN